MNFLRRFAVYTVGMVLLAMGIVLNTKTGLGVSPVVSLPYCLSLLEGFNFANATLVLYLALFVLEVVLKGRNMRLFDLLQIPFCLVFTRCMNLFSTALPDAQSMVLRLVMLVLAIVCTGFGVAIMVAMHLIPNPADGLVQELSLKTKKSIGFTKNAFDLTFVCLSLVIGLIRAHAVVGIGIGTVCAMLGIGRAVSWCSHLFGRQMTRIYESAPLRVLGETTTAKR